MPYNSPVQGPERISFFQYLRNRIQALNFVARLVIKTNFFGLCASVIITGICALVDPGTSLYLPAGLLLMFLELAWMFLSPGFFGYLEDVREIKIPDWRKISAFLGGFILISGMLMLTIPIPDISSFGSMIYYFFAMGGLCFVPFIHWLVQRGRPSCRPKAKWWQIVLLYFGVSDFVLSLIMLLNGHISFLYFLSSTPTSALMTLPYFLRGSRKKTAAGTEDDPKSPGPSE